MQILLDHLSTQTVEQEGKTLNFHEQVMNPVAPVSKILIMESIIIKAY